MSYVTWYNEAHLCYFVFMAWLLHYSQSLHADFYASTILLAESDEDLQVQLNAFDEIHL